MEKTVRRKEKISGDPVFKLTQTLSLFFQFSITEESSKAHLPHRDDAIEVHFVATNSNHKMLPTQMK